ncbi:MAG: metallophosphoesterase family protein [Desulfurococcaceae archaeon]
MKILVLSDIHGNYDALRAVLENTSRYDAIWFLGDYVDYGPEPHLVIDTVKELKADIILMGNHDYAAAFNEDCRCRDDIKDLSVYTRLNITIKLLSNEQVKWLRDLPKTIELGINGRKHYIVHGSPRSPLYGYLRPDLHFNELRYMLSPLSSIAFKPVNAHVLITGHVHIPVDMLFEGLRILNPGSVGQPRDGDSRASYAIYDTETELFIINRVKYNIENVAKKLRNLILEDTYYKWILRILVTGRVDY